MFFVLSKTLSYLTMPFVLVCLCFLLSGVLRKPVWKKRMFWIGFGLLLFFSNDFISNEMMRAWEPEATPYKDIRQTYEMGIVLTGVTVSKSDPDDRVYFGPGADRVTHAVQLYKMGLIKRILVSGRSGRLLDEGQNEAREIWEALLLMGVDTADILLEDHSRNTHESAVEVKKILDSLSLSSAQCLLITSAFHIPRSIACYRKMGLDMDTFATNFYTHPRTFTPDVWLVPRIESFVIWHKLIREWVGFVAYTLAGYV